MNKIRNDNELTLKQIEILEAKYLNKYWHFLKFVEDEIITGFNTKNDIKSDWIGKYGGAEGGTSNFAVGSERIIYALLNGKIAGQPNSSPVSSDLFFEIDDAYIQIDLKSVTTNGGITIHPETGEKLKDNIGDFNTSIFIGENQNTYHGNIKVKKPDGRGAIIEEIRPYEPNLPAVYNKSNGEKKICLTYFITILSNSATFETELVSILCMPNGKLEPHYKERPLKAGKNPGKVRFNFSNVCKFELLDDDPSTGEKQKRVKIIYKNPNMSEWTKNKLKFYLENADE